MSFDDDQNRWEQFLYHLNLLSQNKVSFTVPFHMRDGRVARSTMKVVNDLVKKNEQREVSVNG